MIAGVDDFDKECAEAFFRRDNLHDILPTPLKTSSINRGNSPLRNGVASSLPQSRSSIASAQPLENSLRTFRPQLSNPIYEQIELLRGYEETMTKELHKFKAHADEQTKRLEELEEKHRLTLLKQAEEEIVRNRWGALATVSQYIAGTSTVFVGAASGSWAVFLLGAVGLGHRIVHDTVGWQTLLAYGIESEKTQKSMAKTIEIAAPLLSSLGLATGVWYYAASLPLSQPIFLKKVGEMIALSSAFVGSAAQFGGSWSSKHLSDAQSEAAKIKAEITLLQYSVNEEAESIAEREKMLADTIRTIQEIVAASAITPMI